MTWKVYIPAGNWVVATLSEYCVKAGIGNAAVSGIGSITDVWVLVNPNGKPLVKNWPAGESHEVTGLSGNVALRQGEPRFDPSALPTGAYPVSIGVEVVIQSTASGSCPPGFGEPAPDCVISVPVTVKPYGTFSNWDQRFWFPPPS